MLCCKLPAITAVNKPMGVWCSHARPGAGCGIHDNRPDECRAFHCGWLLDASLGPEWKPDRAKFYINHQADGNVDIMVDPGAPRAWREEHYYRTIKIYAARLRERGKNMFVAVGRRIFVILPERDLDLGVLPDGHTVRVGPRVVNGRMEMTAWIEPVSPGPTAPTG